MKFKALLTMAVLVLPAILEAAPNFWNDPNATPTPLPAPDIQQSLEPVEVLTATPTPVLAPSVQVPTATPTPQPGLRPKNPTEAALFSVVIPGSGQVYAGDPLKGLVFATLFGLGLWQTLDNLQLVHDDSGNLVAKNETAGNLFGLATLAAYGFGIQDAYNTAGQYNKRNNLTLNFGIQPRPNASLAFSF